LVKVFEKISAAMRRFNVDDSVQDLSRRYVHYGTTRKVFKNPERFEKKEFREKEIQLAINQNK